MTAHNQDHPEPKASSSHPTSGRRRLLKVLALGGVSAAVLPEKWVRPVVDAVIVPAHAQGSIVPINGIYTHTPDNLGALPGSFMERLANFVIPSAHAIPLPEGPFGGDCVSFDCTGNPSVNVVVRQLYGDVNVFSMTTVINRNNTIESVNVANYQFFSMSASPSEINGQVDNGNTVSNFTLSLSNVSCTSFST